MNNRYAANCKQCNKRLAVGEGICQRENNRWVVFCASSCNVVAEPVVAEPVVATSKRDIKIGVPDSLSEKARVWARQVQSRLIADLFTALDAAFAQTIGNDDLNMLVASMISHAETAFGGRYNASLWIDWRNEKISAKDILRYANGVDYAQTPACFLRFVFAERSMEWCHADVAAKKEIEAERVAQEAARRADIEVNNGLAAALQFSVKVSANSNTTDTRVFTLINKQTGNAYTYAVSARNGKHLVYVANERGKSSAIFCGFLDSNLNFSVADNCVLPAHSKRLRALVWLFSHVSTNTQISSSVEILDEDITAACNADGCKFTSWPPAPAVVADYDELGEEISYDTLYH